MNFDGSLETFALVPIRRITCGINDGDIKIVGYFILRNYVAQAFRGLWTLVVETTGEVVGDRLAVGFFFHLVGFILFVRYLVNTFICGKIFFTKVGLYFGNGKCLDKYYLYVIGVF